MTSKIKVDNINKVSDDSNIIKKCGTTITLGASGDSIALASGASQTGFGRTGTVDWITTPKTSDFTAVSGEGYFVNSAGGAVIVTLPSSPAANSIVSVSDYNGSASTNEITIARNSSNINGNASDYEITKSNSAVTFVYVDATVGWTSVQTSNTADNVNPFITATGGTETTSGNFKIHTFTGPGTFTVTNVGTGAGSNTVDYLVVAGGAGGGWDRGGGAGAGGYRESSGAASGSYSISPLGACVSALPVAVQGYPITVGGGGAGGNDGPQKQGVSGSNSIFSTITSAGGGGGGSAPGPTNGAPGGSAGGSATPGSGGTGNTPPVSPAQGFDGGTSPGPTSATASGGGGGATAAGVNAVNGPGSAGGAGATTSISGSPTVYAGGGGGGASDGTGSGLPGGAGGSGIGGAGGNNPGGLGAAGTINTGSGGGGGGNGPNTSPAGNGGAGGSGVVVIRYKFQ